MKRSLIASTLAVLLTCGIWWCWRIYRSDERRIAAVLRECAAAAEFRSGEAPSGALLKLRKLESRVEDAVELTLRFRGRVLREKLDRREIISRLAASRKYLSFLEIDLNDLNVAVDGGTAVAEASVQLRGSGDGAKDSALEEVVFTLAKRDGNWRVASVKARDFMEK